MGLKIDVGEISSAVSEMETPLEFAVSQTNQIKTDMGTFINDSQLKGASYKSAKNYFNKVYSKLFESYIELAHQVSDANHNFLSDASGTLGGGAHYDEDVLEGKAQAHDRREKNYLDMAAHTKNAGLAAMYIQFAGNEHQDAHDLREIIKKMHRVDNRNKDIYDDVNQLITELNKGLSSLTHTHFNPVTGKFSVTKSYKDWSTRINKEIANVERKDLTKFLKGKGWDKHAIKNAIVLMLDELGNKHGEDRRKAFKKLKAKILKYKDMLHENLKDVDIKFHYLDSHVKKGSSYLDITHGETISGNSIFRKIFENGKLSGASLNVMAGIVSGSITINSGNIILKDGIKINGKGANRSLSIGKDGISMTGALSDKKAETSYTGGVKPVSGSIAAYTKQASTLKNSNISTTNAVEAGKTINRDQAVAAEKVGAVVVGAAAAIGFIALVAGDGIGIGEAGQAALAPVIASALVTLRK